MDALELVYTCTHVNLVYLIYIVYKTTIFPSISHFLPHISINITYFFPLQ